MAAHLIIDGYNLLGVRGKLPPRGADPEAAREELLRQLAAYRQRKGHAITVVFDGWRQGLGAEHREHRSGVEVIYSRRGQRADEVIQRLAEEYGRDCAVVSSDREITDFARSRGAFVIAALEFEGRLRTAARGEAAPAVRSRRSEPPDRPGPVRTEKKGNPKKLPKAARKRQRRLQSY